MTRFVMISIFLAVITLILVLLQLYEYRTYRRWVRRVFPQDRHNGLLNKAWIVLTLGNILFVLQLIMRGSNLYGQPVIRYTVVYPAGIYFAAVVFGFLILLVKDLLRFLLFWIRHAVRLAKQLGISGTTSDDPRQSADLSLQRRQLLKITGASAVGIIFGTPFVSAIASTRDYRITRIPISLPNLPSGLQGLTIAQLSDVHSGIYMTEEHMMEIVELTNSLQANIVALTGDHVDSSDVEIPTVRNAMGMLKSDYGIYGCLGNHDHFATAEKVSAALEQVGIVMLDNTNRTLCVNGEKLSMLGVDDAGRGRSDFARLDDALKGVEPQTFKVLLSHRPEFFPHAKKADIDLTLAGHTHGGQVGIEFWGINLNPAYLATRYVRGLFEEDGKHLYVNVGVGMVGVPIRIVRPEITLITLQRAV